MLNISPRRLLALALGLSLAAPALAQGPPAQAPYPARTQGPAAPQYPQAGPQYPQPRVATNSPRTTVPQPARAPFELNAQQQAFVDQILELWEKESGKIKSYKSSFERWEYDPVFGPAGDVPKTKSLGQLKYARPDKGMFRVTDTLHYTAPASAEEQPTWKAREGETGEHWVCDGEAVYEFNGMKKQMIVSPLPPEMRGKAIADGPLPFLFGAEKEKLKARYFIRVSQSNEKEIWLEAYPRRQEDAANFQRVELILDRSQFLPTAMQVYLPNGKSRTVYIFGDAKINDPLEVFVGVFQQPRTPLGWTKVVEPIPSGAPTTQPAGPQAQQGQPLRR